MRSEDGVLTQISIFEFQNLNFEFLGSEDYFLQISPLYSYSGMVNPDQRFLFHEANNRFVLDQLSLLDNVRHDPENPGIVYKYHEFWAGIEVKTDLLDVHECEFLVDMRRRLFSRDEKFRHVLDHDLYMKVIDEDCERYWDNDIDAGVRSFYAKLYLRDEELRQQMNKMPGYLLFRSAYGSRSIPQELTYACTQAVQSLRAATIEVNKV
jgi:hypothetical protein